MKNFNPFTDIKQFRNIIKAIRLHSQYIGKDDAGEPVYDTTIKMPKLIFKGTVKLHGTNAGVSFSKKDGMWFQSRSNIITIDNDNAGFAFFANQLQNEFASLFNTISKTENLQEEDIVTIFGEWCGKGIQKGVAISQLEKMFVIFAVKIKPAAENIPPYYIDSICLSCNESNIYNIEHFKTYEIDIDFETPGLSQNKMIEFVSEVEKECPVAKHFGKIGIGEGIVWSSEFKGNRYIFKTKGEKHSISKVKTLIPVDTEKLNSIKDFIEYAVTENRLAQGIEQVFTSNNIEPDISKTGDFLRWVFHDIIKEELDVLEENKITPKEIGASVSNKARIWFIQILDSNAGIK